VTNRQSIVGPLESRVVPEWATIFPERRVTIVLRDFCQTSPANTIGVVVPKQRMTYITFSMSLSFQPSLLRGLLHHFHEHFPGLQRGSYFAEEVDTYTLDSVFRLQSKRETQAVDGRHHRLGCLHLRI
jgi:hypothetical protein